MQPVLTLVCLLLASFLPGAEQPHAPASLKPLFQADSAFTYSFTIDTTTTSRPADGNSAPRRTRHAGELRLNVLAVDDDGSASLSAVFATLTIRDNDTDFTAARPADDNQPAAEKPATEPAAQQRTADALVRAVIRFDVTPAGRVRRVSGLEALLPPDAEPDIAAEHLRLLGPFAPGSIARFLERFWLVDAPGDDDQWPARAAGDSWQLTDERALAYGEIAAITRTLALDTESAPPLRPITLRAAATLTPRRGDPDPTVPALTLNEWREEARIVWNATAGRIDSRDETAVADLTATLGDRARSTRIETRTELKARP